MKEKVDISPENAAFLELRTTNFKKVKLFRVRPDGAGVIKIIGRNDQGKTSAIESLAAVLGGPDFTPKTPIRKGQDKAEVFVDLGILRATRTWKRREDDTIAMTLVVEFADGSKPSKKQSVLDELRGTDLAADPLEFAYMQARQQFDILKSLVPGVDFDDLAKKRNDLVNERLLVGRDRDREKGAADSIVVPPGTPLKPVDVLKTIADLREVHDANALLAQARSARIKAEQEIEDGQNQVDALRIQARELNERADKLDLVISAAQKKLADAKPLGSDYDTDVLQQQIATAETINANVRMLQSQDAHREAHRAASELYDDLTKQIDALDVTKNKAIEQAKLPVKGMSFGDDEILMNGEPFTEASQAQKIMVSMAIAMALKPKLKIISIKDGSLLDADSLKLVGDMATKNKFVVLLERVAIDGERDGIIIEDGEMVA